MSSPISPTETFMDTVNQQLSEDVPAGPGFGLKRPTFGLAREQVKRVEITFAMRGGAVINAFEEIQSEVTEELVEAYAAELAKEITASRTRSFSDSWSATG